MLHTPNKTTLLWEARSSNSANTEVELQLKKEFLYQIISAGANLQHLNNIILPLKRVFVNTRL
jgi:hypothetical protein